MIDRSERNVIGNKKRKQPTLRDAQTILVQSDNGGPQLGTDAAQCDSACERVPFSDDELSL
jgi:hypothetical protein